MMNEYGDPHHVGWAREGGGSISVASDMRSMRVDDGPKVNGPLIIEHELGDLNGVLMALREEVLALSERLSPILGEPRAVEALGLTLEKEDRDPARLISAVRKMADVAQTVRSVLRDIDARV